MAVVRELITSGAGSGIIVEALKRALRLWRKQRGKGKT